MTPAPEVWYKSCFNRSHRDLYSRRKQFFPLNAAVSNKAGFSPFNLGAGDSGLPSGPVSANDRERQADTRCFVRGASLLWREYSPPTAINLHQSSMTIVVQ